MADEAMSDPTTNISTILTALEELQAENATLRETLLNFQSAIPSVTPPTSTIAPNPPPPYQESYPEPKVSLPDKFDGTRSRLRGFINQIRLILRLQPRRYATGFHQVGLLGSLLTGPAEAWFAPLVETASPLLEDFSTFLTEFEATFGETDRRRVALNKIYSLQQGNRATSTYASEFRQLASEVGWGDQALRDQFRRGLRGDVKNLLLSFPEPTSLSDAIAQAVRCDNRLFEFRQEERLSKLGPPSFPPSVLFQSPPPLHVPTKVLTSDSPTPMEVDLIRPRSLSTAQRQHRRDNHLCFYCGASGHLAIVCPAKGSHVPGNARAQLQ